MHDSHPVQLSALMTAVGASIASVAMSTGIILVDSAGNVIAFIANELGKAMFLHAKHVSVRR